MPKIQDIIQNWKIGVWCFLIVAAAVVLMWGLLFLFNQHQRMKPPRARIVIAGCGFIGFMFLWFFLTGLARLSSELNDIHKAAIIRENRGVSAGVVGVTKAISIMLTNADKC